MEMGDIRQSLKVESAEYRELRFPLKGKYLHYIIFESSINLTVDGRQYHYHASERSQVEFQAVDGDCFYSERLYVEITTSGGYQSSSRIERNFHGRKMEEDLFVGIATVGQGSAFGVSVISSDVKPLFYNI